MVSKITKQSAAKAVKKVPRVSLKERNKGEIEVHVSGGRGRIAAATGNREVTDGLLKQLVALGSPGRLYDEGAANFVLGFVDGMQPQDPAEALLVTQMAAIHQATMVMAKRLNQVETIQQQDAAERALNKLARTFSAQMDTLKRYRTKGQQVVRVERVTVRAVGRL